MLLFFDRNEREIIAKCYKCNTEVSIPISEINKELKPIILLKTPISCNCEENKYIFKERSPIYQQNIPKEPKEIKCPHCGSTEYHASKRGWKLTTGFLGSSKIIITCLACGKKWTPGS